MTTALALMAIGTTAQSIDFDLPGKTTLGKDTEINYISIALQRTATIAQHLFVGLFSLVCGHLAIGIERVTLAFRHGVERVIAYTAPIPVGTLTHIVVTHDIEPTMCISLVATVAGILVHRHELTRFKRRARTRLVVIIDDIVRAALGTVAHLTTPVVEHAVAHIHNLRLYGQIDAVGLTTAAEPRIA